MEGKYKFFDKNFSDYPETFSMEPGLCYSSTDILEAMNTLIQERHNHKENSIAFKISQGTQKIRFHLENETQGLAFLVQTWVSFLEARLAIALEYF